MNIVSIFHLIGMIQFAFGCYYDSMYVHIPSTVMKGGTTFGGKLKYLTFLNAMIQTLYYAVALANDVTRSNDNSESNEPSPPRKNWISRIKDTLFATFAFPLAMFVGCTFWGIYAVDRELILPRAMDEFFPTWLNHVMHSNIVIFIIIELITSFRMYPVRKIGLSILTTFMLSYVVWVHVIYFNTGSWVYPILRVLNWPLRIVFYILMLLLVFAMYALGETLNNTIWAEEIESNVRSSKKKAK